MGVLGKILIAGGAIAGLALWGFKEKIEDGVDNVIQSIADKRETRRIEEAQRLERQRFEIEEEERRKITPCDYVDGFTKDDFWHLADSAARSINRITHLELHGATLICTVRSQSGISDWNFSLDYNDFGHITGKCWPTIDNPDSNIPYAFKSRIDAGLRKWGIYAVEE